MQEEQIPSSEFTFSQLSDQVANVGTYIWRHKGNLKITPTVKAINAKSFDGLSVREKLFLAEVQGDVWAKRFILLSLIVVYVTPHLVIDRMNCEMVMGFFVLCSLLLCGYGSLSNLKSMQTGSSPHPYAFNTASNHEQIRKLTKENTAFVQSVAADKAKLDGIERQINALAEANKAKLLMVEDLYRTKVMESGVKAFIGRDEVKNIKSFLEVLGKNEVSPEVFREFGKDLVSRSAHPEFSYSAREAGKVLEDLFTRQEILLDVLRGVASTKKPADPKRQKRLVLLFRGQASLVVAKREFGESIGRAITKRDELERSKWAHNFQVENQLKEQGIKLSLYQKAMREDVWGETQDKAYGDHAEKLKKLRAPYQKKLREDTKAQEEVDKAFFKCQEKLQALLSEGHKAACASLEFSQDSALGVIIARTPYRIGSHTSMCEHKPLWLLGALS